MAESNVDSLIDAIDKFSKQLHREVNKPDDNYLFSPVSIHAFLTLLSQDPWFHTKHVFETALGVNVNDACSLYKDLFAVLNRLDDHLIVNTTFLKHRREIVDTFGNLLKNNFASEVNILDTTDRDHSAATINAWVGDRTSRRIKPFDSLKDDAYLEVLSSTYLKNVWMEPFPKEETTSATFHLDEQNTVQVEMMRKKGEFYYGYSDHMCAKILKLPTIAAGVSLVVVLPDEGEGEDSAHFIQRISHSDVTEFTENLAKEEVEVSLPKFKIDQALDIAQYIKEMGLEEVFAANLNSIIDGEELTCDKIQQKVFLEVNEEGAEAAAGTVSGLTQARDEEVLPEDGLVIYEANISSEVSNRFGKTKVVWRVKNTNKKAADAEFKVVLTDTAFITEFVMEIGGKSYKSYIKGKEEAKNIYNEAVAQGQSAGLVEAKTRDSREFSVSVNLEPDSVAVFSLTYEEMLQRLHDQYELVLNICPGQIIDDLTVEVRINESRPLKFVKTPPLRSGNDTSTTGLDKYLDPLSDIKIINSKTATVKFRPDPRTQKRMTHYLGNRASDGLLGQFVVQYDVEREPVNGEILLQDGYFVHFFAPNDLAPLPKHVVFVLDTSGSMQGRKMEQVRDAMTNILGDLRDEDMLSIIEFNSSVVVWDVDKKQCSSIPDDRIKDFEKPFTYLKRCILADPHLVSERIISNAKEVVQDITAGGGTFMIGGLETGLYVVRRGQKRREKEDKKKKLQPVMVFLTDGEPNVGIHSVETIVELVTKLNAKDRVPIFSLSFGDDADKDFLRKLSLKNQGFSRHIYEAADASLQLQQFYKQISSPLLSDINFKYDAKVGDVTRTWFPIYFGGAELVVAGRCTETHCPTSIDCHGPLGLIVIQSVTERPVTSLERLWAYLTVKQLLDERDSSPNPKKITERAVNLALKYSFVTDVTSLVVVKPDETATTLGGRPPNAVDPPDVDSMSGRGVLRKMAKFMRSSGHSQMNNIYSAACSMDVLIPKSHVYRDVAHCEDMGYGHFDGEGSIRCLTLTDASDSGKKATKEFTANRPFLIILQLEKDDTVLVLFKGLVYRPEY